MLKPLLLSPVVLLLALVPLASGQKPRKPAPAAEEPATPKTINVEPPRPEVKQIYKFDCAVCHGETGNGKTDLATSMSLTLGDWTSSATLAGKSDEELYKIIRNGKDKMPPEDASRAKDDEIRGLVKYIRSLGKNAPAMQPASQPATEPASKPADPAATPTSPTAR
jgi:mono/diheme cytochrome c family protein